MKCPNGHVMTREAKHLPMPEGWWFCPHCPFRNESGKVIAIGMAYGPNELQAIGQSKLTEVQS